MQITERQSGTTYVTIRLTIRALDHLEKISKTVMYSNDCTLVHISEMMLKKLDNYDGLICSTIAELAHIIDQSFWNDLLRDCNVLSSKVTLLDRYSVQSETPNEPALNNFPENDWIKIVWASRRMKRQLVVYVKYRSATSAPTQ